MSDVLASLAHVRPVLDIDGFLRWGISVENSGRVVLSFRSVASPGPESATVYLGNGLGHGAAQIDIRLSRLAARDLAAAILAATDPAEP